MAQGTAVADERRARATARYVRMTPMKVRRVVDLIRGMEAREALSVLQFAPQAASEPVAKVLASAVANAEHNQQLDADTLVVAVAYVDEGPTLKRFRPRAQGRAFRINKRTSHITIEVESVAAAPAKAAKAPAKATKAPARATKDAPAKKAPAKAAKAAKDTPAKDTPAKATKATKDAATKDAPRGRKATKATAVDTPVAEAEPTETEPLETEAPTTMTAEAGAPAETEALGTDAPAQTTDSETTEEGTR